MKPMKPAARSETDETELPEDQDYDGSESEENTKRSKTAKGKFKASRNRSVCLYGPPPSLKKKI